MPLPAIPAHTTHPCDGRILWAFAHLCCRLVVCPLMWRIGRSYEVSRDTIVEVTDEDLDQMPLPTARAIELVACVPADSIDPIRIADSYYLAATIVI
jgi:hypothetical protein